MNRKSVRRAVGEVLRFWWWRLALVVLIVWCARQLAIHTDGVVAWIGQMRQEAYPSTTHFVLSVLVVAMQMWLFFSLARWALGFMKTVSRKEVFTVTGDNGDVAVLMSDGSWSVYYSLQPLGLAVQVSSSRDDVNVKTDAGIEESDER